VDSGKLEEPAVALLKRSVPIKLGISLGHA
jgi:hypothetical protein